MRFRQWLAAQARAVMVVAGALDVPALAWIARLFTPESRIVDEPVAGIPALVIRPGRGRQWPALVFVNGVTAEGRHHPRVVAVARALAHAGFLVCVPDPPGLARGPVDGRTLDGVVAVASAISVRADVRGGRFGLAGVSIGATLALAAAEGELAEQVTVVAGIGPYTDLANAVRLATTGYALDQGRLVRYATAGFLALVFARSIVAALPASRTRDALLAELDSVPDDDPDPLAGVCLLAPAPDRELRAVVDLLANRDPARFDALYAALPAAVREGLARLSPLTRADRLRAPVELAVARNDKYLPFGESLSLVRAATNTRVRLTVTSTLDHAVPKPRLREFVDLARFDGWVVRALDAAGRP